MTRGRAAAEISLGHCSTADRNDLSGTQTTDYLAGGSNDNYYDILSILILNPLALGCCVTNRRKYQSLCYPIRTIEKLAEDI